MLKSPPQEFVNVKRQTIYAFIPYLNIWAFYRIQKLKKYSLIAIGLVFAFIPIRIAMFGQIDTSITNPWELYTEPLFLVYTFGMMLSTHGISAYFVRKWSIDWNEKLESGINISEKIVSPTFVESRWEKPNIYITMPGIILFVTAGILGLTILIMYYDNYLMAITFTIPAIIVSITSIIGATKLWNRKKSGVTISMISLGCLTIVLPMNLFFTTGLALHLDYPVEVSYSIVVIPMILSITMISFLLIAKKQVLWNESFLDNSKIKEIE